MDKPTNAERTSATPLVSILVPAYNAAPFLRGTLDSLLAQTYQNIEIILLDDASTDATPDIAAEYASRIIYVRQHKNLGIYDNVNVGIGRASGDLIATYHADDVYLSTIVQEEVAYLNAHPNVGAIFCCTIFVNAEGCEYGRMALPPAVRGEKPMEYRRVLNALLTYKNHFLMCPTAMVRASVHRDVGVYLQSRYRNTSDLEMWLRIARRYPIAVLESHLIEYRHFHGNSSARYHHLRTLPENFFTIIDEYLAYGDRAFATPRALVNYEAHRSEDRLMAAISHYIRGEQVDGRRALREVQIFSIFRTPQVQRLRLLLLTMGMWGLLRLPRMESIGRLMYKRWHANGLPARRAERKLV
jgi:glycosyltransferase involved in cell wall biosynthesis